MQHTPTAALKIILAFVPVEIWDVEVAATEVVDAVMSGIVVEGLAFLDSSGHRTQRYVPFLVSDHDGRGKNRHD